MQNLSWKVARVSYRIGGFVVPANKVTIAPLYPGSMAPNEPSIDLGGDWAKVPSGNPLVSCDLVLTITLHYRSKLLVETSEATAQCATRVVEPATTGP
jgi:hypothetical protein